MRVPLAEVGNRFICAKTLSKMCCLSKASSHFVVFVCVNPDRERLPSIESPKHKSFSRLFNASHFMKFGGASA